MVEVLVTKKRLHTEGLGAAQNAACPRGAATECQTFLSALYTLFLKNISQVFLQQFEPVVKDTMPNRKPMALPGGFLCPEVPFVI